MTDRVIVDVGTLRAAASALLDRLSELEGREVTLEHDMFWSVDPASLFNVYAHPADLSIGQLSESWANLCRMVDDDRFLTYGLVWLGDLLRAIGLEIVK
jgi:hypothetical protein